MLKVVFGARTGEPAFFDMGARFKPKFAGWYGGAFRIGDRAAAYTWLGDWRLRNPDRRLVVIEDSVMPGTEQSRHLDGQWLFNGIADELWKLQSRREPCLVPPGESLYHVSMWRIWKWLQTNAKFQPSIRPKVSSFQKVEAIFHQWSLPKRYVTVQPLFDAGYDTHRNQPPIWWKTLIHEIAAHIPVVVLGDARNRVHFPVQSENIFSLWRHGCTPMDSLAAIAHSALHIGGETGTTLWAPILKIPTFACYRYWGLQRYTDTRPISFGQPVVWIELGYEPSLLADRVNGALHGALVQSTPLIG